MYQVSFISSISQVSADAWDGLQQNDYPFAKYGFLLALEASGATTKKTGWEPHHILVHKLECSPHAEGETRALVACMPCYRKYHSYGEYVFDFEWAAAYQRYGFAYYPKLVSAIPFSPVTGPRLLYKKEEFSRPESESKLIEIIVEKLTSSESSEAYSSFHLLFPRENILKKFGDVGLMSRVGVQYHWFNEGYESFDDFLAACSSRKRKNIRKERTRVYEQGVQLKFYEGEEITPELWKRFYWFYQLTYTKRSGHGGYLSEEFFHELSISMPDNILLVIAEHNEEEVAGALFFKDSETLYGRYWGCIKEFEMLHFEACYYQGIEYCIQHGLKRFDPGAQGEHKIQRGFKPVKTYSNHWIKDMEFRRAIGEYLDREHEHIDEYIVEASSRLPFKA